MVTGDLGAGRFALVLLDPANHLIRLGARKAGRHTVATLDARIVQGHPGEGGRQ
jgi:hypothetical protein